jgi:hypothetical protein
MTPVQVQKAMFLLAQEAKSQLPQRFYKFAKYNYGPFCQQLYNDLALLAGQDLVVVDRPFGSGVRVYRVTEAGASKGRAVSGQWTEPLRRYVQAVSQWVTSLSFPDLVRSIYHAYPQYKENSIFVDR